jgi:hypothetical protein
MALPITCSPPVSPPSSGVGVAKCSTSQIGGETGVARTLCCHIKGRDGRGPVPISLSGCAPAVVPVLQPRILLLSRRRLILRQPPGHVGYRAFPPSSGYLQVAGVQASAGGPSSMDSEGHSDFERAEAPTGVNKGSEGIVVPDSEPESGIPSASSSSDPAKTCNVCGHSKLLVDFEKTVSSVDERTATCRACLAALKATRPGSKNAAVHLRLTPEEAWERAKICTGCKVYKEIRDFAQNGLTKDGTSHRCRSCISYKNKQRRVRALMLPVDTPQQCKQCNAVKPATEYYRDMTSPSGLHDLCKPCYLRREKDRHLRLKKSKVFVQRQEKLCTTCKRTKPVSTFHKNWSKSIDGLANICKDCSRANSKRRRQAAQTNGAKGARRPL